MTTRLELRTQLRRRLGDSTATPLWDDALLNDLLAAAIRRYGARFPAERSTTVSLSAGATTATVSPSLLGSQVVRVIDPYGNRVPRLQREGGDEWSLPEQAWRWWGASLLLLLPATAGSWRIDYLGSRDGPSDDITAVDLPAGDEEIALLLAAGLALRRRATDETKRGETMQAMATERAAFGHERVAADLIGERKRGLRGSWLE